MWSKIFCLYYWLTVYKISDSVKNLAFCLFLVFPLLLQSHVSNHILLWNIRWCFKHLVHKFLLTFFCLFSFCFSCLSNSIKNIVSSKAFSFLTCGHGLLTRTLTMNGMWTFTNKMTAWPWRHLDPLHVEGGVVRGPVTGARTVVYLRMNEVRIYGFGVNNMPLPIMPNF